MLPIGNTLIVKSPTVIAGDIPNTDVSRAGTANSVYGDYIRWVFGQ